MTSLSFPFVRLAWKLHRGGYCNTSKADSIELNHCKAARPCLLFVEHYILKFSCYIYWALCTRICLLKHEARPPWRDVIGKYCCSLCVFLNKAIVHEPFKSGLGQGSGPGIYIWIIMIYGFDQLD